MSKNVVNVAILGSTRGTDMNAIMEAKNMGELEGVNFKFVLSNKRNARILDKAEEWGIEAIWLGAKQFGKDGREAYDNRVTEILEENDIDLILLIGYMRLMSSSFVKRWWGRVMNIHPSLLPAFAGGMDLNVHQAVLDRGCTITGATLMFIDEGVDTGPIILQGAVRVDPDDDADSLKAKVQTEEGFLLVEGLRLWRDGKIKLVEDKVIIDSH
jgi:phosphoribosylglycinamide formyltransferase-1